MLITERLKNILVNAKETDKEFIIIHLKGNLIVRYTTKWEDTINNHIIMTSRKYDVYYIYKIILKNLYKIKRLQYLSVIPYYRKSDILNFKVEILISELLQKKNSLICKKINNYINDKISIYEKIIKLHKDLKIATYQQINNYDYKTIEQIQSTLLKFNKIEKQNNDERLIA